MGQEQISVKPRSVTLRSSYRVLELPREALTVLLDLVLHRLERSRAPGIWDLGFRPSRRLEEASVELLNAGEEDEGLEVEDERVGAVGRVIGKEVGGRECLGILGDVGLREKRRYKGGEVSERVERWAGIATRDSRLEGSQQACREARLQRPPHLDFQPNHCSRPPFDPP